MKIIKTTASLAILKEKINTENKVFYIRFGDNDIFQMTGIGRKGRSIQGKSIGSNRTLYSSRLANDIKASFIIKDDNFMKAVTLDWDLEEGMTGRLFGRKKPQVLYKYVRKLTDEEIFYHPVVFHYLFIFHRSLFEDFLDNYINTRKVLFVGRMTYPGRMFKNYKQIKTKDENCYYDDRDRVLKQIQHSQFDIIILACGQLGRAIAHELWNMDRNFHCIDLGSIVDYYDGRVTRGWIRKIKKLKLI